MDLEKEKLNRWKGLPGYYEYIMSYKKFIDKRYKTMLAKKVKKYKYNQNRLDKILEYRVKDNMTLDQIGFQLGLTRERIRQISEGIPGFPKRKFVGRVILKQICPVCKKKFERFKGVNKKCCSRKCGYKSYTVRPPLGTAKRRKFDNIRMKKYYHEVLKKNPVFKEKIKERNRINLMLQK